MNPLVVSGHGGRSSSRPPPVRRRRPNADCPTPLRFVGHACRPTPDVHTYRVGGTTGAPWHPCRPPYRPFVRASEPCPLPRSIEGHTPFESFPAPMEVGEWIDFEELEHDIDAVTYRKHSKHDPADLVVDYGEYHQAYSPMDGDGLERLC